jgi:hypothetical protein
LDGSGGGDELSSCSDALGSRRAAGRRELLAPAVLVLARLRWTLEAIVSQGVAGGGGERGANLPSRLPFWADASRAGPPIASLSRAPTAMAADGAGEALHGYYRWSDIFFEWSV